MPLRTATNLTQHRALIILLRVVGVVVCTAIIVSVMPTTWVFGIGVRKAAWID